MGLIPDLKSIAVGSRINLVGEMVLSGVNDKHLIRVMGSRELVILHGSLTSQACVWTFLDVMVCEGPHKVALHLDEASFCYGHSPLSFENLTDVVELCAGAGYVSTGLQSAGFAISAGVEQNERFRMLYDQQGLGDFIHSDIGDPSVIKQILCNNGQNSVVAAGIACQPYSTAGDGKGGSDPRASTLPKTLEVSWMIQSPVIIIECTPRAMHDPFVQSTIDHFCSVAGYVKSQGILNLEHSWASARARWWCILSAIPLGSIPFPAMPQMLGFQRVDAIMPYIKNWPQDDLSELTLSEDEHRQFHQYSNGGLISMALDTTKHMQTALHSWGNQCCNCACGCRGSLSEARLQSRGIFGVVVPSKENLEINGIILPVCRHLHPAEVSILCGAFPLRDWHNQLRLGLAAAGQMASPLQSCWVGSHVMKQLTSIFGMECPDPSETFRALIGRLLAARDEIWPSLKTQLVPTRSVSFGEDTMQIHVIRLGVSMNITCPQGISFRALMMAESKLIGCPLETLHVKTVNGIALDVDAPMTRDMEVYLSEMGTVVETPDQIVEFPPFTDEDMASLRTDEGLDFPMDSEGPSPVPQAVIFDDGYGVNEGEGVLEVCHGPHGEDKLPFRLHAALGQDNDDPLCKVSQGGFLCMLCPRVADSDALQDFRAQQMEKHSRVQVLTNQGLTWADDELLYQLQTMAERTPAEQHVLVWDPLLATSLCKFGSDAWISDLVVPPSKVATIITVIEIDHHWIPVVWRKEASSLLCFAANASAQQTQILQKFHHALCFAWWVPCSSVHVRTINSDMQPNNGCGLVALEFVEHLLFGKELDCSQTSLLAKHSIYRQNFVDSLGSMVSRPWVWGKGNGAVDPKQLLMALLKQHGIGEAELSSRYEMLCQKLGRKSRCNGFLPQPLA